MLTLLCFTFICLHSTFTDCLYICFVFLYIYSLKFICFILFIRQFTDCLYICFVMYCLKFICIYKFNMHVEQMFEPVDY